jgi:hypothetical protein
MKDQSITVFEVSNTGCVEHYDAPHTVTPRPDYQSLSVKDRLRAISRMTAEIKYEGKVLPYEVTP